MEVDKSEYKYNLLEAIMQMNSMEVILNVDLNITEKEGLDKRRYKEYPFKEALASLLKYEIRKEILEENPNMDKDQLNDEIRKRFAERNVELNDRLNKERVIPYFEDYIMKED